MKESETLYRKVGRRYVPVAEHDDAYHYNYTKGTHLTVVKPGVTMHRYNIDPAFAPMIAAGCFAEDNVSRAIVRASEIRLQRRVDGRLNLTVEQNEAWNNLIDVFGDDAKQLEWPSARECAEEGVRAMCDEAEKLLKNESIKRAYEHFLLVCALSYEEKKD
jgi:hypothetical protein